MTLVITRYITKNLQTENSANAKYYWRILQKEVENCIVRGMQIADMFGWRRQEMWDRHESLIFTRTILCISYT